MASFYVKNNITFPVTILGVTIPVHGKVDLLLYKTVADIKSAALFGELYYKLLGKVLSIVNTASWLNLGFSSDELDKLISTGLFSNFGPNTQLRPYINVKDGYMRIKMVNTPAGRVAAVTDASTYINWKLDDVLPAANLGTAGTLPLQSIAGTQTVQESQIGKVTRIYNSGSQCYTDYTALNPSATSLTISCWVCINSHVAWGTFFSKCYRNDTSWAAPYTAFELGYNASTDGRWTGAITVGATQYRVATDPNKYRINLNEPTFVALTYDGVNIKLYQNGILAATQAQSGNIDYGTNGRYLLSCTTSANQNIDGCIGDVRIENAVRTQSYLESVYKQRMGWGA